MDVTTLHKPLREIPMPVAQLVAKGFALFPSPPLTTDALMHLTEDNVARTDANLLSLSDLGIEATSMEKVAFDYLHRFRAGGHFTAVKGYYSSPH
jgi:NADH dehydrogenase (ubiquinone) 1 alpha subcomplex subunit 9